MKINNIKDMDLSNPQEIYWNYVKKIPKVHEERSKTLSPKTIKIIKTIESNSKILDVCGGTGRWSQYLVEKGYDVKLVDLSNEMLEIARKKGLSVEVQDALNLKEKDNSYDAVICLGNSIGGFLTEEERKKSIKEMIRVSKNYVIIDTNNRLAKLWIWIPLIIRKKLGKYHSKIKLQKNVWSGNQYGDILWYDPDIGDYLYHYICNPRNIKDTMESMGLNVRIYPHRYSATPILIGRK